MMFREGKPLGWWPQTERDHFLRCPACGEMLDMRDLGQILDHLHGKQIEEEPPGALMTACKTCDDVGWVCEAHPDLPWDGPRACPCGAAGAPCPHCNVPDAGETPRMPPGFIAEVDEKTKLH